MHKGSESKFRLNKRMLDFFAKGRDVVAAELAVRSRPKPRQARANRTSAQMATPQESWEAVLDAVQNTALKDFIRAERMQHQEARLERKQIIYRVGGRQGISSVAERILHMYGRRGGLTATLHTGDKCFPNRVAWRKRTERKLRFYLTTAADFAAFDDAMRNGLTKVEFL